MTIEEFIQKAREKHGNKYDYSKITTIKNSRDKVVIVCPEHGEFTQRIDHHLNGCGCPVCFHTNHGKDCRLTAEEFFKRIKEVHGDKYDYSKVEFNGLQSKIRIICPEHGEFWQKAANHLAGKGCKKCGNKIISEKLSKFTSTEEFIKRAREVHGDKYDYSKVVYKGNKEKVCIVCPEHGEFWQSIGKHLSGQGCRKCKQQNFGITKEEFIQKAREKHGNKYDYSKVNFVNITTRVCIICPEHGEFWKTPSQHLNGQGCPNCSGIRKHYKFNLLKEFESEYAFRAFLENNDPNILLAILNNICEADPKFNPIKKDIEKALENSDEEDPISKLENKYSSNTTEEEEVDIEEKENTAPVKIDLDNEEQFDEIFGVFDEADEEKELTIEDAIKNTEKEIKIMNKIDHIIAPELRIKIMSKLEKNRLRQIGAQLEKKLTFL